MGEEKEAKLQQQNGRKKLFLLTRLTTVAVKIVCNIRGKPLMGFLTHIIIKPRRLM
jgi:hypothetical protein